MSYIGKNWKNLSIDFRGIVYKGVPPFNRFETDITFSLPVRHQPSNIVYTFVQTKFNNDVKTLREWYEILKKYDLHKNEWKETITSEWKWW